MDKSWIKLGKLLVDYSMAVKPGEKVMIAFIELESYPLVNAIYRACIEARAYPQVQFLSEELNRQTLLYGSNAQIGWVPELEAYGMEWADVYFGLRGAHNLDVFWDIPSDKLSLLRKSMGQISTLRWQKTRWCLMRVPNAALAQQAGMDEDSLTEMIFNACFLDWPVVSHDWQRWASFLNLGKQVRILGEKTDLSFSIAGRTWDVANGHSNMPDGEIATAPIETTLNGYIYFENPGVLGGRLVDGISLRWEHGRLVDFSSTTNQDFLKSIINTDRGASLIGEFAIGTNPEVTHFCKDILIDEKIDGTIHIALGRAYPKVGGTNSSAIHWDIIKDMHHSGELLLDGKAFYRNGKMLI